MALVLDSSSVLGCVDAVSSSDAWLGLGFMPLAFEATIVQLSLQSLFNILSRMGTGVFKIEKQVITLLFNSYAAPPCHTCCGPGLVGKRVFPALLMETFYPAV